MKNTLFTLSLLVIGIPTVSGQTREQQRRADAYYQNEQHRENVSESSSLLWDLLFGATNAAPTSGITADEIGDGEWYAGQHINSVRNGLGINYTAKPPTYTFSSWQDNFVSGLTLVVSDNYSFFGGCDNGKKHGFGMTSWSSEKPLEHDVYENVIKYVGEYKAGEWHGYGILYFKDGTYLAGTWDNSTITKELPKIQVLEALGF